MNAERDQLRHALLGRLSGTDADGAWAGLLDAGVLGLRAPEAVGGLGLSAGEIEPVFDILGELCLATPYLETGVIAAGLLSRLRCEAGDALLARIVQGGQVAVGGIEPSLTLEVSALPSPQGWRLSGSLAIVVGGMDANVLLVVAQVEGEPALFALVNGWQAGRRAVPTIDGRLASPASSVAMARRAIAVSRRA
jgi:alkylation response protein AidB-like acyl-CoA dehydrogenase